MLQLYFDAKTNEEFIKIFYSEISSKEKNLAILWLEFWQKDKGISDALMTGKRKSTRNEEQKVRFLCRLVPKCCILWHEKKNT